MLSKHIDYFLREGYRDILLKPYPLLPGRYQIWVQSVNWHEGRYYLMDLMEDGTLDDIPF